MTGIESSKNPRPDDLPSGYLVLDKYLIVETMSRSNNSVHYKVKLKEVESSDLFALKIFNPSFALNHTLQERLSGLSHKHFLGYLEQGKDPHLGNYLLRKYIKGKSLRELLAEKQTLNTMDLLDTFMQVCRGLNFLRRKSIVHANIKPENILIDDDYQILLCDPNPALNPSAMKNSAPVYGDPLYMSPELLQNQNAQHSCDIYSVAICMYECLAANPPFAGTSPTQIAMSQVQERPKSFADLQPARQVEPQLETVIFRCLEKDPSKRYQLSEDLEADLKRINSGEEIKKLPSHGGISKNLLIAAALMLIFMLISGAALFAYFNKQKAEESRAAVSAAASSFAEEEKQADEFMNKKRYNQAGELYNKLEPLARANYGGDSIEHVRLLHKLARCQLMNQEADSAIDSYLLLCDILSQNKKLAPPNFNPVIEISKISKMHFEEGDFRTAAGGIGLALKLQETYKLSGVEPYKLRIWRGMADARQGKEKQAMTSFRIAVDLLRDEKDQEFLSLALQEYASSLASVGHSEGLSKRDKERGIRMLRHAEKIAGQSGNKKQLAKISEIRKSIENAVDSSSDIDQ